MRTVIPENAHLIPNTAKPVFRGKIYDIYHWPQKMYDGTTSVFEMLKRVDTVKVLAIKDGKLIFLQDEQPGQKRSGLTLPGGRHDRPQETELDCAKREMMEETGMVFDHWRLAAAAQPSDEIEWFVYIFVAWDVQSVSAPTHGSGEKISIQLLNYDQAMQRMPTHFSLVSAAEILRNAGSIEGLIKN